MSLQFPASPTPSVHLMMIGPPKELEAQKAPFGLEAAQVIEPLELMVNCALAAAAEAASMAVEYFILTCEGID